MFDVLITGGMVIDGSGKPGYRTDVGIVGEKINAIGDLSQAEARRVIDATGHIVSPGFIDTHVHSDGALLNDPQHAGGLRQGVTTEILGQDGLSYAPTSAENYRIYNRYLSGILGRAPDDLDMSSVEAFRANYHKKCAINTAYPIAHGALRLETCGFYDVPMIGDRLKHAKRLVREGMEQGAIGFATGLSYHPQSWSDTTELIELCKVVAEYDGIYITHLRNVNPDRGFGGGGVPEALEIGRKSGVKVHFSHFRTAANNVGEVQEQLEPIDKAKAEGLDITLELYPYPTGSTFLVSNMESAFHEGGPDGIIKRLSDPAERAKVAVELESNTRRILDEAIMSHLPNTPQFEGLSITEIAKRRGKSSGEAAIDLFLENDLEVGFWLTPPDDIRVWRDLNKDFMQFLSRPDYMVGSDAIQVGGHPHPRAYGTFPRFLGRLRRQVPIMTVEQIVQRMSDNPARRFGLTSRGRIEEGYFADVVVFDSERIVDVATYDDPQQHPAGIPFVLVNGEVAVDHERCTGIMAGQAIP
jgi:N-acyl-D-amino-acid deacylase